MQGKWFILMLLCLTSCVEPFILDSNDSEELLVVEGIVSNQPGPYVVNLSLSSPIDEIKYRPLSDCEVYIEDEYSNSYSLQEIESGTYKSDNSAFVGVVGQSYRLIVQIPDGETYESDWERILKPVKIKDIKEEVSEVEVPNAIWPRHGYQFYVEAESTNEDTVNLLWKVDATYEYRADFQIDFYYDGSIKPFLDPDIYFVCYKTYTIPDIFVYRSSSQEGGNITNQALHFEDTHTRALTFKYALNVYQLRIGNRAFKYWNELAVIKAMTGQFFDRQPFQIKGNMRNRNKPEEEVLGYFMAAAIDHKLEFFTWKLGKYDYSKCVITDVETMAYGDVFRSEPNAWPIYITENGGSRAVVEAVCLDCRTKGGVLEKPVFWE
tara:strand:- start:1628 stop:2764 length:1137 start_codon:yes stop_codon:yes gene_type:complete